MSHAIKTGFIKRAVLFTLLTGLFLSCTTTRHIYDEASLIRHQKLKRHRAGNAVTDALITTGSIVFAAITGESSVYTPEGNQFRKVTMHNTSTDTLLVNMLTDYIIQDTIYCDFMDIRIPPMEKCRLLLPKGILYNVYFSNTPVPEDDEMIEVDTGRKRRVILYPGMTVPGDTTTPPVHLQ
jgi:hypothetical protein